VETGKTRFLPSTVQLEFTEKSLRSYHEPDDTPDVCRFSIEGRHFTVWSPSMKETIDLSKHPPFLVRGVLSYMIGFDGLSKPDLRVDRRFSRLIGGMRPYALHNSAGPRFVGLFGMLIGAAHDERLLKVSAAATCYHYARGLIKTRSLFSKLSAAAASE
jgi:hypothetical protein